MLPTLAAADMGSVLDLWTMLPFAMLLASIALLPLWAGHWWESNHHKTIISLGLAVPVAIYFVSTFGAAGGHILAEKVGEYVSFITLLTALFVIAGGIRVDGTIDGTPLWNTMALGFGACLANLIGTTGASVLMIRPLLRANEKRWNKQHIFVFFILVVSNCGGLLTPMGDPPLFLGYLKGVPFIWTLKLWKPWLLTNSALLVIFNFWDQVVFDREERDRPGSQLEEVQQHEPLQISGLTNLVFLTGVVGVILAGGLGLGNGGKPWPLGPQEGLLIALAVLAYRTTPSENRLKNRFSFGPMIEVAVLFVGIFVTMTPALLILNAWGRGDRMIGGVGCGLNLPWHFFWASGALSSVLDNAPTYLTFAATICGKEGVPLDGAYLADLLQQSPAGDRLLTAVACGSVFMGANTYIGNGPNFMVKAIAEENGVRMPSFFHYMLYTAAILGPLYLLNTWLFFS